jgi:hypothetical protein
MISVSEVDGQSARVTTSFTWVRRHDMREIYEVEEGGREQHVVKINLRVVRNVVEDIGGHPCKAMASDKEKAQSARYYLEGANNH